MALAAYETAVYNLIQAPSSPTPLATLASVDTAINSARQQLAADAECIRRPATLALTTGVQSYAFSSIAVTGTANTSAVISVRMARITTTPLDMRSWEWFQFYYLGDGASGTPVRLAQQGQGVLGTLFFDPTPNGSFTVSLDVAALPIALADDTTSEAIPYPWTDAIQFYAAWIILMNLQRQADANTMLARYKEFVRRGRQESTPTVLPGNLPGDLGAKEAAAKTQLTLFEQRPQQ